MNKKDEEFRALLNKYDEEIRIIKEKQLNTDKKVDMQNKKNKSSNFFLIFIFLFISGITSVASYSMGASSVAYTPKDASWQVENTQEAIDNLFDSVGSSLVGSVYSYMGVNAPAGYLACDGSVYNISDYPRLSNHIKVQFGKYNFFGGDGETTFAVPDLRGEFLRGTGTNSHANQGSGASVGVHQNATQTIPIGPSYESSSYYLTWSNPNDWYGYKNADSTIGTLKTGKWIHPSGNSVGTRYDYITSRPTNTSVLFIIKY
ncbi:MAG: tail fiber protein [Bacilli bacterium]|nr:tail fiber protein [Bacilli bacterium]